jgi:glutathione S-transferase
MLELYHGPVSTASERARFVLEEKGLPWTSHPVDLFAGGQHTPEYRALNPMGQVPTLVHDGFALRESSVIAEYLDETFPDRSLRPASPRDRARARLWDKTIDEVHPFTGVITYAIAFRPALLRKPKDELAALVAAIADPARRALRQSVLDHGVAAPEMKPALGSYLRLLDEIETQLADTPFLAGAAFSTADTAVAPFINRIDHLGMGALIAARPRAQVWFGTIRARPAFQRAVTDVIPPAVVETFRVNGAEAWPAIAALAG